MPKKKPLNQNIAMTCEDTIQAVAATFAGEYTNDELNTLKEGSASELKAHIEQVVVETLLFASILPGRPSRPKKPTV